MSEVILELTGGLGNQLFNYAYARSLARRFGLKLVLDSSTTERVLNIPADIFSFTLDGEERRSLSDYSNLELHANRFLWKTQFTRRLTRRVQSSVLHWDEDYETMSHASRLRGLFQGKLAFEVVREDKERLFALIRPSKPYLDLLSSVKFQRVIAFHVRRGDYRQHSSSFGLLSAEYYFSVFTLLKSRFPDSPVWLYSDEPKQVVSEFLSYGIHFDFVLQDDALTTAETLKLMSNSAVLITANSTYSWWAAMLGNVETVIAPSPWFRNEGSWLREHNLIPSNWQRHSAVWKLDNY